MVERRTRRRFTAEFKAQAVKRLLEGGKPLAEVATELGLSTGQLSTGQLSTLHTEQLAVGSAEALVARKAEEARRSETGRARRTCSTQARRRAGPRSFPALPRRGSACPA
jgi:transposase